jgi:hypothetical protein
MLQPQESTIYLRRFIGEVIHWTRNAQQQEEGLIDAEVRCMTNVGEIVKSVCGNSNNSNDAVTCKHGRPGGAVVVNCIKKCDQRHFVSKRTAHVGGNAVQYLQLLTDNSNNCVQASGIRHQYIP